MREQLGFILFKIVHASWKEMLKHPTALADSPSTESSWAVLSSSKI